MRYLDLEVEFEVDGSLRDIYAFNTTVDDWNRLLTLAPSLGEIAYFCDGEEATLPTTANSIFEDVDHAHLLRIDLGGPVINTHFFQTDEIELDLDPCEVASQADLDLVLNFCASIGREIKRDIRITPEALPEIVYLCYVSNQEQWRKPKHP